MLKILARFIRKDPWWRIVERLCRGTVDAKYISTAK